MPIRGLPAFVNSQTEGTIKRISLKELAASKKGLKIVIDGEALLWHLFSKFDWTYGGEYDSLARETATFATTLHAAGIRPLVVFNGVPNTVTHGLLDGGLRKTSEKIDRITEYIKNFELNPLRGIRDRTSLVPVFPPLTEQVVIDTLRAHNIHIRICEGDAIRAIHHIAITHQVLLVGYDSNYLCLGNIPGYIHCDSLNYNERDVTANLVIPHEFAESIGVPPARLSLFAALVGSAAFPEWCLSFFHKRLYTEYFADHEETGGYRRGVLIAVANWLAAQPETLTSDEIFEVAIDMEVEAMVAFREENTEDENSEEQSPAQDNEEMSARQQYRTSTTPKTILRENYAKHVELFTPQELKCGADGDFEFDLEYYKANATVKHSEEARKAIVETYFTGELSAHALSVLLRGIAWIRPTIESTDGISGAKLSQKIRALGYSILLGPNAKCSEAIRVGSEQVVEDIDLAEFSSNIPTDGINDVVKLDAPDRINLFLRCLGFSEQESENIINLPENIRFFTLCLMLYVKITTTDIKVATGVVTPDPSKTEGTLAPWEIMSLVTSVLDAPTEHTVHAAFNSHSFARFTCDLTRISEWQYLVWSVMFFAGTLGVRRAFMQLPLESIISGMRLCYSRHEERHGRGTLTPFAEMLSGLKEIKVKEAVEEEDGWNMGGKRNKKKRKNPASSGVIDTEEKAEQLRTIRNVLLIACSETHPQLVKNIVEEVSNEEIQKEKKKKQKQASGFGALFN